jgi:diguanylate cyclase (GGDEF)-like protein/PAS domain S-box-containing protein
VGAQAQACPVSAVSGTADIILIVLGLLTALLIAFSVFVWLRRMREAREVDRLRRDVHRLLAADNRELRLTVSGRAGAFVDVAATINRLVERAEEASRAGVNGDALFDALADTLPDIALIHTQTIQFANRAAGRLFGVSAETLVGKATTDLLRPAYRTLLRDFVERALRSATAVAPVEVQLINADDGSLWVEMHSRRITFRGEPALISVARDITHRKSLEATLGRSKLQARVTLESIGEGVITTDTAGVIDYMNEAAEQLTGTSRSFGLGKRLTDVISLVDEVDRESLGDPVRKCLNERRRVNLGKRALLMSRQSDKEFSTELTASPIRGPEGEVAGCVVIIHDVTELRGLTREMSYQASHDALTGLVNRAEFERRLESALASARGEGVHHVVAYLDLDRFKIVNDTSGHIAGDNLLRELAVLLRERVRDSDTVARVGGDEFAMLLAGCPLDKARQIADDVCQAVADYRFTWRDRVFDIGLSVGLVQVGQDSGTAETVLSAADSACYVAKTQGRGRVHVYSARDEIAARQRGEIHWLQRLQQALKENLFELYVQPIIALDGERQDGPAAEVLLRMRDESGRSIAPAQFLAAAERYRLMSHIDRWVVQTTLTALASGALHLPENRSVSVNLSGQTLGDEDFLEFVVDMLDHTGVHPGMLCFEVSETAVVMHMDHAQRFINVLHGMGCRFTLDNFGGGVGSFANLKHLSLDYLKIDGMYLRDLDSDMVNREMVSAMVKLARTLDFRVVAGQVEDQVAFDAVRQLGVDFVQGFIIERPRPLAA